MPEAFVWPEGTVSIGTGTVGASAVVAFAENTNITLTRGWSNNATLSGTYYDHLTGAYATVSIGALYTVDATVHKINASATAVHMKFMHSGLGGTGGMWLYSGRIDSMSYAGTQAAPYRWTMNAHFNVWSAF